MPSIAASSKVLVTGANGFIGSHIVKALLDNGYAVRGTVRDDAKGEYLTKLFNNDKFEFVVVANISEPGAFDDAVKGVDAVIHSALSFRMDAAHPDDVIIPVVAATVGILDSAKKRGSDIKRILFTSSIIAVLQPPVPEGGKTIFTEKDWNEAVLEVIEKEGKASGLQHIYGACKVLSERAAWDWIKVNKDAVKFDITTVCPPWVYGPMIHKLEAQKDINGSNLGFLMGIKTPGRTDEQLVKKEGDISDVRDIAKIHVDLLAKEGAGNERFIPSAGAYSWQDVYDALNASPAIPDMPTGNPAATKPTEYHYKIDTSKLQALLGVPAEETYRPVKETIRDLVEQVARAGLM